MMAEERELCDDCGRADSNGVPCALMFKKGTGIQSCSGHVKDPVGHERLTAAQNKADDPIDKSGKRGGGK